MNTKDAKEFGTGNRNTAGRAVALSLSADDYKPFAIPSVVEI